MKIWAIAKIALKECLRQRVVYFIFLISLLFVVMAKGCDVGTVRGEGLMIGKELQRGIALGITFHGIVFWSIMLCGLLASQALTRDADEGTLPVTLARPVTRAAFVAGRLLAVLLVSALNLLLLAAVFLWFFYRATGSFSPQMPLGFLFMAPSLALYTLMTCALSQFMPRLLAPMGASIVYVTSCWSSLPYFFENLKILWTPSGTVERLHAFSPRFGDLQFMGSMIMNGQPLVGPDPLAVLGSTAAYALLFWYVAVRAFNRREL